MSTPDRSQATSARAAASLLALAIALVASSCSRGEPSRARAGRATPSATGAASPEASPGGDGAGSGGDGNRSAPGRRDDGGAGRGSGVRVPNDPAAVVDLWLRSVADEDYAVQRETTVEGPRVLTSIRDIIQQENARRGAKTDNTVDVQERPRTTERSGDSAQVSFRARNEAVVSGPKGTLPEETEMSGPVTLRRIEGEWRIVDYTYGGTRLSTGYFAPNATQTMHEFTLVVASVLSYKRTTAALVRLVHEGEGRVPLAVKSATVVAADGSQHEWTQFAFETRDTPAGFLGFPRIDGRPRALRVEVARDDTKQAWTYELTF